jgi:hypothetical protein
MVVKRERRRNTTGKGKDLKEMCGAKEPTVPAIDRTKRDCYTEK